MWKQESSWNFYLHFTVRRYRAFTIPHHYPPTVFFRSIWVQRIAAAVMIQTNDESNDASFTAVWRKKKPDEKKRYLHLIGYIP